MKGAEVAKGGLKIGDFIVLSSSKTAVDIPIWVVSKITKKTPLPNDYDITMVLVAGVYKNHKETINNKPVEYGPGYVAKYSHRHIKKVDVDIIIK